METERSIGERCWFRRTLWMAAASCGRLWKVAGPPLLKDALIWRFEALGRLRHVNVALGEVCDARERAPACRESMACDATDVRLNRCNGYKACQWIENSSV